MYELNMKLKLLWRVEGNIVCRYFTIFDADMAN